MTGREVEWTQPMTDNHLDPPDEWGCCEVCGKEPDGGCDCTECPECNQVGNPKCYLGHMEPMHDSIQSLLDHEGCGATLAELFRVIERHSSPCYGLWVVIVGGQGDHFRLGSPNYEDREKANAWPAYTRVRKVGVSGIAWDGSDWEHYEEVDAGNGWSALDDAKQGFADALEQWDALKDEEDDTSPEAGSTYPGGDDENLFS